ncbi:hypothetical protein ACJX0J_013319, partial [Zea mays]
LSIKLTTIGKYTTTDYSTFAKWGPSEKVIMPKIRDFLPLMNKIEKIIIIPKNKGGLGVINLEMQNQALFTKYMHKFYAQADLPWLGRVPHFQPNKGFFWWKDIARLSTHFMGIASPIAGDGISFAIWRDVQLPKSDNSGDVFIWLISYYKR